VLGAATAGEVTDSGLIQDVEKQPSEKIANHAWYTFWYVLPTLPMFLLFPMLMQRYSFWLSLLISSLITVICFWLFSLLLKLFGIDLLP
jgi:uncharacterized membrane protein